MSTTRPGRHRAAPRISAANAARGTAMLAVSGGLVTSMSVGAQATPAPATPAPTTPAPAAPVATLPTAPVTLPTAPVITTPSTPMLRWGSRGSAVRTVQEIVGTGVDGIFGPLTHNAVKRWQGQHGLYVDGIVGPNTKRAMGLNNGAVRADPAASRSAPRQSAGGSVVGVAQQYTGIMYQWGGSSPSTGFDCSGFTQFVFAQAGMSLPRTAEGQRQATTPVSSPQPGDLVFWGAPAYHTAIYAGNGMIYDSGRPGLPTQKRGMFSGVTGFGRVG